MDYSDYFRILNQRYIESGHEDDHADQITIKGNNAIKVTYEVADNANEDDTNQESSYENIDSNYDTENIVLSQWSNNTYKIWIWCSWTTISIERKV